MDDDPTTADLFIAAVLKVAGPDGMVKVRALGGGAQITIALYATEGSFIARALGMADAERVCAELRVFDAEGRPTAMPSFYLPKNLSASLDARRDRVLAMRLDGKNKREIAVTLGLTDATIRRDLRILEKAGRLPVNLPSFHPHAQACIAAQPLRCEALPAPDHFANAGGMVPPPDEVPS